MTDEMEGQLTRWLRFLGYNTRYAKDYECSFGSPVPDEDLIRQCFLEHRILITRDREMVKKFNKSYLKLSQAKDEINLKFDINHFLTPSILLDSTLFVENMSALHRKFNIRLTYDSKIARCSNCNFKLMLVKDKSEFREKIPDSVYQNIDEYWICRNKYCNKIYWIGGHFKDIFNKLTEIKENL